MKIEIEYEEVEALKKKLERKETQVLLLEAKIKELDELELKKFAVKLSYKLLDDYMTAIFKSLGFSMTHRSSVLLNDNPEHWLGEQWYTDRRVYFEIGATITSKFKNAFLSIGILTEEQVQQQEAGKTQNQP